MAKNKLIIVLFLLLINSLVTMAWFPEHYTQAKLEQEKFEEMKKVSCVEQFSFLHSQEQFYLDELIRSGYLLNILED